MADIEQRVHSLLVEHLGVDAEKIAGTATLADLGADSLDLIELEMAAEEDFGFRLTPEESNAGLWGLNTTVAEAVAIIQRRVAA